MILGLDLDGTCLDFQNHWADTYEHWFDREVGPEARASWDGLTTGTHFAEPDQFWAWSEAAQIWETCPWNPGALAFVDQALRTGNQVRFITARHRPESVRQTMTWFGKQRFSDPRLYRFPALIHTGLHRKSIVPCSTYIDDSPAVIEQLKADGRDVLIFDQPWNQYLEGDRVATWSEALDTILGGLK